ncbi:MAG TPA: hypothetical protein DGT21_05725 [Armatimonadetes bacterium]|nr:hypothetical protein [Armatimonadota bacterium]
MTVVFPPLPANAQAVTPAVIYPQTNSVTIEVLKPSDDAPLVPQTILNRPAPEGGSVTASITAIPAGAAKLRVKGWSGEDGEGNLVSRVAALTTILIGQKVTRSVVMDGYPTSLQLAATANPVLVDLNSDITPTPIAADGTSLQMGDFTYQWESSDNAIAAPAGEGAAVETAGELPEPPTQRFVGISRGSCTSTCRVQYAELEPVQVGTSADPPVVQQTMTLVVDPNVDTVTFNKSSMSLNSGQSDSAVATAWYKGVVVPNVNFSFQSSAPAVATVTKDTQTQCTVTGVKGGTATIRARQPYTSALATLAVTVPEGDLDVIISSVSGD